MNIGVIINPRHLNNADIYSKLKEVNCKHDPQLSKINYYVFADQMINDPELFKLVEADTKLDFILVFGGDGTMLHSVPYSMKFDTPLLGVNLGHLGFLTDSTLEELDKSIKHICQNKYTVQDRMLIKVSVKRDKKTVFKGVALNDAVIYKGVVPKLIDIRLFCDRRYVLKTRCDGIIVATPTGSTAYSLSSGGPILSPVMDAIVVSPLNPHVLTVRPMVFDATDNLSFELKDITGEVLLQLDGVNLFRLMENDEVNVTADTHKVSFIKLSNKTFYQVLRNKLHMGRR